MTKLDDIRESILAAAGPKPTHQAAPGTLREGDVIRCSSCNGLHEVMMLFCGVPVWACPEVPERDCYRLNTQVVVQVVVRAEQRCNGPDCALDCPGSHGGCVP